MKFTIEHYMWGYQRHYRTHVKVAAEHVLNPLDEGLNPDVFLVGILQEDRAGRHPTCVEPEEDYWIESEAFNGAKALAVSFRTQYVEAQMFQFHPVAQQRSDEALDRRSIRDAILQIIDLHPSKPVNRSFFASVPVLIEGYLVSVVYSIDTTVLNSHYRLASGEVSIHEYRNRPVARSLIDAAMDELLDQASDGLLRSDPGLSNDYREAEETIRAAGRRLVRNSAFRTNQHALDADYFFYDACDKISALKYEQTDSHGRFLLAGRDTEGVRTRIKFKNDLTFDNYRRIRKLLELTSSGGALHTDSEYIFGLVDYDTPTSSDEDVFEVIFVSHHHWELHHHGQVLMGVKLGEPYVPKPIDYDLKLRRDLPRIFHGIEATSTQLLLSLVRQAEQERHGTLLIISPEASSESSRLTNQATAIEPCLLTPELLGHLTGIDGAVLLDTDGHCHAIGAILDGQATSEGDPARGARFNSAVRYLRSLTDRQIPALAVVVSEDGGVDLIPDLRPMIKRSELESMIVELEENSRSERIRLRRYNYLYNQLIRYRFYLLADDCRRINSAIQEIEKGEDEKDPMRIKIIRHCFEADPKMDPALYYEPEEATGMSNCVREKET